MKLLALMLLAAVPSAPANADVVRLHSGQPLAQFSNVVPGAYRYIRYKIAPDGSRSLIDTWERRISFVPAVNGGGQRRMRIERRWDPVGSKPQLSQDSWFEAGTFKPLTHVRRRLQDGTVQVRGFRFSDSEVTQLDGLPDNAERNFRMPLAEPSYNFENDMELLQALPLAPGRTFDIPFYDPGIDKPDRYLSRSHDRTASQDLMADPSTHGWSRPITTWDA